MEWTNWIFCVIWDKEEGMEGMDGGRDAGHS